VAVDPATLATGTTTPAVGAHTYNENSTVEVTANAVTDYVFSKWTVDGADAGTANPISVTMDAAKTVTAVYTLDVTKYDLAVAVDPATLGADSTTPAVGVHPYADGATVEITANTVTDYVFSKWTVDGADAGTANPLSVSIAGANKSVTAVYVTAPKYDLTIAVNPATLGTDSTTPAVGVHPYTQGTSVDITATALVNGYKFDHWTVGGTDAGNTNPLTVTLDAAKTVTAVYTVVPTYNLTVAVDPANLSVNSTSPAVGVHTYEQGSSVDITANTVPGFTFTKWLVDGTDAGTTSPLSVTLDANKNVTAVFTAVGYIGDADNSCTAENAAWCVDIFDALLVAKYAVGLDATGINLDVSDVDCVTGVTTFDALKIAEFDADMVQVLPDCN
jgi:hypothetical protein